MTQCYCFAFKKEQNRENMACVETIAEAKTVKTGNHL